MARCDYKINRVVPIGYGRAMVHYTIYAGDFIAQTEEILGADNLISTGSVTRYRRTSVLATGVVNMAEATMVNDMNRFLHENYVNGSRPASDEQEYES